MTWFGKRVFTEEIKFKQIHSGGPDAAYDWCPYRKGKFGPRDRHVEERQREDTQEEHREQREAEIGLMQRKPRTTTGFWLHQPLRGARKAPFKVSERVGWFERIALFLTICETARGRLMCGQGTHSQCSVTTRKGRRGRGGEGIRREGTRLCL